MNKIYCVIKNLDGDILVTNTGCKYTLPNYERKNSNNKIFLSNALYTDYGLHLKKSYLILKLELDGDLYYICEEPYSLEEFNKGKKKAKFIPTDELKEKLPRSSKVIDALSIILHTKFSYSKKEREETQKKIDDAIKDGDDLIAEYLTDNMFYTIVGNYQKLEEINKNYSNKLISLLCCDLNSLLETKLSSMEIGDFCYQEAVLAGKKDEWEPEYIKFYNLIAPCFPAIPAGNRKDYFTKICKLENKPDLTINILIDMYNRYKNFSYEEIISDIEKRQKEKNQNRRRKRKNK